MCGSIGGSWNSYPDLFTGYSDYCDLLCLGIDYGHYDRKIYLRSGENANRCCESSEIFAGYFKTCFRHT